MHSLSDCGDTSNTRSNLANHHSEKIHEDARSIKQPGQKTLKEEFTISLPQNNVGLNRSQGVPISAETNGYFQ